ncbi:hypothetical protein P43SY_007495 [Pythium insidiosum]|uniref:HSF-type DNA-binding domain-containing protein n=1 Tax=Pythium insidiosum TaxID=114742 RepID=A0AAD5LV13_PYTIN|nr:hypothetical protein P43SY_007495 [Pythium insidiosum]
MNVADMLSSAVAMPSDEVPASPTSSATGSTSSTDASSSGSSVTSEMLKRGWIAPFLLHLHQMLRRESASIIRWTEDGLAFQILDKVAMTEQVLPKYFKNKNFASFQRQLNYFGFRKWSKARAEFPTYSREHFSRDNYSAMSLVKRQSKKSRKRKASDSSVEVESNKRHAAQGLWISSDRCKPILPRPDVVVASEPQHLSPLAMTPTATMPALPPTGDISPLAKAWATPAAPNPFLYSPPTPVLPSLASIPALSPTRKIPSGCKLPSLRELSASGALLSDVAVRPCWLA